jgi:4-amino-4-deoxy-L-arabinose transferase-like glycosyltransferase
MTGQSMKNRSSANLFSIRPISFLPWVCIVLILLFHFLYLMRFFAPAISTPDANGYWAQGSLISKTGHTWFYPENDLQYINFHWHITESGKYYSKFPPGLPLLVGLIDHMFGFKASILINPVLAGLSLLGLFLFSRRLLGRWWGLAAVFVMAVNPSFNQQAIWCFAHMAVIFCLVYGLYLLAVWSDARRPWQIFLAGMLFGCVPAIRYPEALFLPGFALFLLTHYNIKEGISRHHIAALLGLALPLVPFLIRNHEAFGAFYKTGYALTNEQSGIGLIYLKNNFFDYIRSLNNTGIGLFFPLGLLGMIMMAFDAEQRRYGLLFIIITIPVTLLYTAYYWPPEPTSLPTVRFMLPTFVCYALAGIWLLIRMTDHMSMFKKSLIVAVVLVMQLSWALFAANNDNLRTYYQKQFLADITDALERNTAQGDIIIADKQILQHLDFVRNWRLIDLSIFQTAPVFNAPGPMPPDPMVTQIQEEMKRNGIYQSLSHEERKAKIPQEIRKWAGKGKVYYAGAVEALEMTRDGFMRREHFRIIETIPFPEGQETSYDTQMPPGFQSMPSKGMMPPMGFGLPFPGIQGKNPGFPVPPGFGQLGMTGKPGEKPETVIAEWTYSP